MVGGVILKIVHAWLPHRCRMTATTSLLCVCGTAWGTTFPLTWPYAEHVLFRNCMCACGCSAGVAAGADHAVVCEKVAKTTLRCWLCSASADVVMRRVYGVLCENRDGWLVAWGFCG